MRDIPFVDAHMHLWDLALIDYPWLSPPFGDSGPNGSTEPIAKTYLLKDYLHDARGWTVAGAVHVEAGADPAYALTETRWIEHIAARERLPNGAVAFAALDHPQIENLLAAHTEHGIVRGIRHIVNWHADPRRSYTSRDVTGDDAWQHGFALLGKYGLSFDCQAYTGQFETLAALFARHPHIPVVIDHLGSPIASERDIWAAGIAKLAALPHVAIKLSGAGFVARPWDAETIRPYVRGVIDAFGPARCMVASDFPTDKLFGGFDATLEAYAALIADYSERERRAMWGGNADRFYRLGLGVA